MAGIVAHVAKEGRALLLTERGFVLAFRDRALGPLPPQLKTFDAEEWRFGMAETFQNELKGFAQDLLRAPGDLLAAEGGAFLARLNPEILNISGSNLELYNFIHSPDPFRVKARVQAIGVLPLLKWEFARMDNRVDRIRRRIDAGKSVWEAFLDIHPGKAAILRRLAESELGPEAWRGNLAELLRILDPVPPEKIPVRELDWNAFQSIVLAIPVRDRYLGELDQRVAVRRLWVLECARYGWQKAFDRIARIEGGVDAITDVFDFLDEVIHAGDWLAPEDRRRTTTMDQWMEERNARWVGVARQIGLFRLLEASAAWHRQLWAAQSEADPEESLGDAWPPLVSAPIDLPGGLQAVVLHSRRALSLEGQRMQHCVGSYWLKCYAGESHILSIRDAAGTSRSTLEIALPGNGARDCDIVQHRALGNRTPEIFLREQEPTIKGAILRDADFEALARWRKEAAKAIEEISGRYKVFDRARFDRLAEALGRDRLLRLFNADAEPEPEALGDADF